MRNTLDYPLRIIATQRILHGERPYVDFQVLYGPLSYYISALLQYPLRHLPPVYSANAENFLCCAIYFAILFGCALRHSVNRLVFSVVLPVAVYAACFIGEYSYYSLLSLLPLGIAACIAPRAFGAGSGSVPRQVLIGILIALGVFMRINFGLYLGASVLVTGLAGLILRRTAVITAAARSLMVAVLAAAALAAIFNAVHILRPSIADTLAYIGLAPASRHIPLSAVLPNAALRPLLISFGAMLVAMLLSVPARLRRSGLEGELVGDLLLCAFASYAAFRFDEVHIYPALLLTLLLLVVRTDSLGAAGSSGISVAWRSTVFAMQAVLFLVCIACWQQRAGPRVLKERYDLWRVPWDDQHGIRNGVSLSPAALQLIQQLDAKRRPGEEVFIGNRQGSCQSTYDMCADIGLYLAIGTLPRQHVWWFDTTSTAFDEVQQEIIAELERRRTPWVIVESAETVGKAPIAHQEAPRFTQYVQTHYSPRHFEQDLDGTKLVLQSRK
jgi:hypothetical protein